MNVASLSKIRLRVLSEILTPFQSCPMFTQLTQSIGTLLALKSLISHRFKFIRTGGYLNAIMCHCRPVRNATKVSVTVQFNVQDYDERLLRKIGEKLNTKE